MKKAHSGPKQFKSLKNNYLSLFTASVLLLFSAGAHAQYDSTRPLQPVETNGNSYRNGEYRSTLRIPKDTLKLAVKDSGAIAYKGGTMWMYNGRYWVPSASGSVVSPGFGIDSIGWHNSTLYIWTDGTPTAIPFTRFICYTQKNIDRTYDLYYNCNDELVDSSKVDLTYFKAGPNIVITLSGPYNDTATISSASSTNNGNGLLDGGIVSWSGTGLIYNVTSATYVINNVQYTSAAGSVTLSTSDPSNDRIDVIKLNTSGGIDKETGTASANPATPQVDPATEIALTSIIVTAASTVPEGVTITPIYDEDIEWSHTVSSAFSPNFGNTVNPFHLTKSVDVPSTTTTKNITFTNIAKLDRNNYSLLKLYVKLKAALPSTANIQVYFRDVTTSRTAVVTLGAAQGFDKMLTSYQNITLPLASTAFNSNVFDNIVIQVTGASPGFYLDWVQLQGGISQSTGNGNGVANLQQVTDAGNTTTRFLNLSGININAAVGKVIFNLDSANLVNASGYQGAINFDRSTGNFSFQSSVSAGTAGGTPSFGTAPLTLKATGGINLGNYGGNFFTGTPAYDLSVVTGGNLITMPLLSLTTTGSGAATYNNSTRVLNVPTSAGGSTPDSSWDAAELGKSYPIMGTLYDTAFQAMPYYFSDITPVGNVSTSNKLILSGFGPNWHNYLQNKYYGFDKEMIQMTVVPQTRNSTDYGLGITFGRHVPAVFAAQDNHLVISTDFSSGPDSGSIKMGYDTTTFLKRSNQIVIKAGDTLDIKFTREGWALTTTMLNRANNQVAEVTLYDARGIGTGGMVRLHPRSLGTVHVLNFKVTSWNRKNGGIAIFGPSLVNSGASSESATWPSLIFNGNKSRFNTFGFPSITMDSALISPVPEIILSNPEAVIINMSYNDRFYLGNDTTTFKPLLDSAMSRFQRAGIKMYLVNIPPSISASTTDYNTALNTLGGKYGVKVIDAATAFKAGGTFTRPNYFGSDQTHWSDSGHLIMANVVAPAVPEIYKLDRGDSITPLIINGLPNGTINMNQLVIDAKGGVRQVPSNYNDSATKLKNAFNARSPGNMVSQKDADLRVDGLVQADSGFVTRAPGGFQINFGASLRKNLIAVDKLNSSGNNYPEFNGSLYDRTILLGTGYGFFNYTGVGTGVDNVMIGYLPGNTTATANSYSRDLLLGYNPGANLTSGSDNLFIGYRAGKGITTGSKVISIQNASALGDYAYPAGLTDAILIGSTGGIYLEDIANGDIVLSNSNTANKNFYPMGKASAVAGMISLPARNGGLTNQAGFTTPFYLGKGVGNQPGGTLEFYTWNAGSSGSALNTVSNKELTIANDLITVDAALTINGKVSIATGSNASVGTATLVSGTVTVSTTAAATASKIFVTVVTPGGTQGFLSVPTIVNGTSFTINSTSGSETSTVNWWIIN